MISSHRLPTICLFPVMVLVCNCENALRPILWEHMRVILLFLCHARTWEPTMHSLALCAQVCCAAILILSVSLMLLPASVFVILETLLGRPVGPCEQGQPTSLLPLLPAGPPFSPRQGRRFQLLGERWWLKNSLPKHSERQSQPFGLLKGTVFQNRKEGGWSSAHLPWVWLQPTPKTMNGEGIDCCNGQRVKDGWKSKYTYP